MRVKLNIEEDEELRNYIKSCIKGQVMSILREEIMVDIRAEIVRKYNSMHESSFYERQEAFISAAKEIIYKESGISDYSTEFINPLLNKILTERIGRAVDGIDWKKTVDKVAQEKIKSLIS